MAVTVSIGVATATELPLDRDGLIGRADEALYAAKAGGRDRVVAAATEPDTEPEPGRPAAAACRPSPHPSGISARARRVPDSAGRA